ncbi:MAG TPA: hypothetical protein VLV31_10420 [Candidatus Acidoferrales bacterium]|nr:hypothetical protein [Candidatus Acidoferrales bacterium]
MSQSGQPNNSGQSAQPSKGGRGGLKTAGIIGLVIIAILSLGFAGYTAMTPHATTVTQQQMLTNTQNVMNTQTQTVTSIQTVNQAATVTQTNSGFGYGNGQGNNQVCMQYGCYPGPYNNAVPPLGVGYYYNGYYYAYDMNGNYVPPCTASGTNSTASCQGFIYQNPNGCTELVIPIQNAYIQESTTYQFYSLHNLPSSVPSPGTWVTVTGQSFQGANTASNGASCPGNYINVTSIS